MNVAGRACAWLAPEETVAEPALPLTLLVRPVPLLSLVLLAVNDHYLKGSGLLPGWLTGKLSDFAGLAYFPLLLVTGLNLVGWAIGKVRQPPRFSSPTMRQVVIACAGTAVFFSAVQVSPWVKDLYARVTALLSFWSDAPYAAVTMDPSDIMAVPAVALAWWQARQSLRQLPPGRLGRMTHLDPAVVDDERWAAAAGVADVAALLGEERRARLRDVVTSATRGDVQAAERALEALRA